MAAPTQSLSHDLFEDMGRKIAEASAEGDVPEGEPKIVDAIESLCMNCQEQGTTRLLLTKIPFFREIVIMSFDCTHCGFRNSEVTFAGEIQERGAKYTFKLDTGADLSRQVVKSDTCIFRIEDLDLEIPAGRGQLTNVEGILVMIASDLTQKQPERKEQIPELYEKIDDIIKALEAMANGFKLPFVITIDDPAGNSWIEPSTTDRSGKYTKHEYPRDAQQNAALGLTSTLDSSDAQTYGHTNGDIPATTNGTSAPATEIRPEYHANQMVPSMPNAPQTTNVDDADIVEGEVYTFPASCPGCTRPCATNMKMVNIPHFKQVVLMSTVCDSCGYRSNEVKTGGEIPELGRRITLEVKTKEDLSRDILKSESCAMSCPELSLSVEPGTLGGRFTTIEGLLTQVRDDLRANIFSDNGGDSMQSQEKAKWDDFFGNLTAAIEARKSFTIVLQDPLAMSYMQSLADAGLPDAQMKVEDYERTEEEEEEQGLRDIKVENYEEGPKPEQNEKAL